MLIVVEKELMLRISKAIQEAEGTEENIKLLNDIEKRIKNNAETIPQMKSIIEQLIERLEKEQKTSSALILLNKQMSKTIKNFIELKSI